MLTKPVNVRGDASPDAGDESNSVGDVREIELVLKMPHRALIGKTVIVNGTLFHAFTGHHHTEVLIDVKSISLAALD